MTATLPGMGRQVAVVVAADHCSAGCVGIHAAIRGTRFEAFQPIRQGGTRMLRGHRKRREEKAWGKDVGKRRGSWPDDPL